MEVLLDTTGRFLTFPDEYIDQLAIILERDGKSCIKPTAQNPLVQCQCQKKDDVKTFKGLSFKFNKQSISHRINPESSILP
jgi:hypothetical protein